MIFRILFLVAVAGLVAACQTNATTQTVLKNVRIVDVTDGTISKPSVLVIQDEQISSISVFDAADETAGIEGIDLAGHYVIPGLINGHVHFTMADEPQSILPDILYEGVTGIRDLGGPTTPIKQLSQQSQDEPGTLPDVYFTATIAGAKFKTDPRFKEMLKDPDKKDLEGLLFFDSLDEVPPFIKWARQTGASGLKLYTALTDDQLAEVTRLGEEQGLKIYTHAVIFPADSSAVVNSNPTEIIHTKGLIAAEADGLPDVFLEGVMKWIPKQNYDLATLAEPRFTDLLNQMADNNIALNPALIADGDIAMRNRELAPWQNAMREWACAATKKAHQAGVVLTAGTDYDGGSGLLNMELKRLTDCGLSPAEAIKAATLNNAIVLGISDEVGTVAEGKRANLIILPGDPTQDLSILDDIKFVIKDGTIMNPQPPQE